MNTLLVEQNTEPKEVLLRRDTLDDETRKWLREQADFFALANLPKVPQSDTQCKSMLELEKPAS